jgi:hypothetical protein
MSGTRHLEWGLRHSPKKGCVMGQVKHRQTEPQHMEATAHPPRAPYQAHVPVSAMIISDKAHLPHGQKGFMVTHQSHPIRHQSLPQLQEHQE